MRNSLATKIPVEWPLEIHEASGEVVRGRDLATLLAEDDVIAATVTAVFPRDPSVTPEHETAVAEAASHFLEEHADEDDRLPGVIGLLGGPNAIICVCTFDRLLPIYDFLTQVVGILKATRLSVEVEPVRLP
jgi:hypothetical protein